MTNQSTPGWLTIRQAATQLGVSELTVRRRIKDGKIAHRFEGGKYYVNLDLPVASAASAAESRPPRPAVGVGESDAIRIQPDQVSVVDVLASSPMNLDVVLSELSRLAEQAGRTGLLEDQVSTLEARCAALQSEVVTLAGRNGWLESQVQEREKDLNLLTDSHRRRGWRRLFG